MFSKFQIVNEVKELIQGNWYFENSNIYIKIKSGENIVENDSPYSEDYKIIGDTLLVKGFEANLRGYVDTLKVIKLTKDTLILKDQQDTLILFKK